MTTKTGGIKLYDLSEAYQRLQVMVLEGKDGWQEALAAVADAFEEKAQSVAKVVLALEGEAGVFEEEAKRLLAHARARTAAADRLKEYLRANMESVGVEHVKGLVDLRLQASPPSVTVNLEVLPHSWQQATLKVRRDQVPEELLEKATDYMPLKRELLDAWKRGEALPQGAEIVTGKRHLVLR